MANALEMLLRIALRKEGVDSGLRDTRQGVRDLGDSAQGASTNTTRLGGGLGNVTKAAAGLAAGLLGGVGIVASLKSASAQASEFGGKMAEVATLLDDTSGIDGLTASARALAREFGTAPTEQAQALYDIISAGASDAAAATDLLTAANKLAQGGVTDVKTAADGLTSILNAYGLEADESSRISDGLFAAMRAGKTTVGELSANLGQVTPIAAQAGVSFEEIAAATATLTKGGVSTSQAVTQLRGIISSVIKPSGEAAKVAEQLGLQFDVQALQAQGLSGFLQQVADKTGGNTEQMAVLFGQVEALGGALSLTGTQADDFSEVLDSVTNSAGETDKAVAKIADSDQDKFEDLSAAFSDLAVTAGDLANRVLVPLATALKGLVDDANDSAQASDELGESVSAAAAMIDPAMQIIAGSVQALGGGLRAFFNLLQITVASVLQFVVDKAADTAEALSHVTFGDLSDDLARHAALMRQTSADLGARIQGDLGDIDDAGESVRTGFGRAAQGVVALDDASEAATSQLAELATETDTAGAAAGITAEQLDAMGENAEVAAGQVVQGAEAGTEALSDTATATQKAGEAADKTAEQADKLGTTVDTAGKQAAKAGKDIEGFGKKAEASLKDIEQAYKTLGLTSSASLQKQAADAQAAYETIRDSGTASVGDIERAYLAVIDAQLAAAKSANDDFAVKVIAANAKAMPGTEAFRASVGEIVERYIDLGTESESAGEKAAAGARKAADAIEPWRQKIIDVQQAARKAAEDLAKAYDVSNRDPRAIEDRTTSTAAIGLPPSAALLLGDDREILQQYVKQAYSQLLNSNASRVSGYLTTASQQLASEIDKLSRQLAGGGAAADTARAQLYRSLGITPPGSDNTSTGTGAPATPTTPGASPSPAPTTPGTGVGTGDSARVVSLLQSIDRRLQIIIGQIDDASRGGYSYSAADLLRELDSARGVAG